MNLQKIKGLPVNRSQGPKMDSSLAIINVVLLLIFFFIASGSLLASRGVEVVLPETLDLPLDMLPEPLLVILDDGSLLLDGTPVPNGNLAEATKAFPILHLLSDKETNAGLLLDTLAAENLVAVELRLVTIHRSSGESE